MFGRWRKKKRGRAPLPELRLVDYRPRSTLIVPVHEVPRPKYPAVDAHNHLGERWGGGWDRRPVSELLDTLDAAGVEALIDLDGGFGEDLLHAHLDRFKNASPERFVVFGGADWSRFPDEGNSFGEKAAKRLEAQKARGAGGLKIWKSLGLTVKDAGGRRVAVDDPRLDPLWATAGELQLPVTIHVGDPVAFFEPLDATNERFEEIATHPDYQLSGPGHPRFPELIEELARLVARHPRTTFIGAHVGNYPENLGWVSALLDRCPNLHLDLGARLQELGRQPNGARKFFLAHADRILFGLDRPPRPDRYAKYWRFLETDDDYFNASDREVPTQGRWFIHGIQLPADVLEKIYRANARRILGLSPGRG
ncbi:MAG: amidohydrolase family protein [Deltaproteobacteria bacterium]|nr:amidohydrolase family protein [Deltaproteobacteria bacterium]